MHINHDVPELTYLISQKIDPDVCGSRLSYAKFILLKNWSGNEIHWNLHNIDCIIRMKKATTTTIPMKRFIYFCILNEKASGHETHKMIF